MQYLLDSVILIDHFNGIRQASEFISKNKQNVSISVITRAEVLAGIDVKQTMLVKQFLDLFTIYPLNKNDADLAARLRQREKWKLPDAFQAAITKNNALKLATRNTKDFSKKNYSFVVIPYEL